MATTYTMSWAGVTNGTTPPTGFTAQGVTSTIQDVQSESMRLRLGGTGAYADNTKAYRAVAHADVEVLAEITFPASGEQYPALGVRATVPSDAAANPASMYFVDFRQGAETPRIVKRLSHSSTDLAVTGGTAVQGQTVWCRFRVTGSTTVTLKARIWTGSLWSEPAPWTLEATDSTSPITAAGNLHFQMFGGNTGTTNALLVHEVTVDDTATPPNPTAPVISSITSNGLVFFTNPNGSASFTGGGTPA